MSDVHKPLLQVDELGFTYGPKAALSEVSLELAGSEVAALVDRRLSWLPGSRLVSSRYSGLPPLRRRGHWLQVLVIGRS